MLAGVLDATSGETGLLIVSGGNEIVSGAHAGMAQLAARVAARGYPVFRFDRRGVGDSSGENRGFEASADDIAAAVSSFRTALPSLRKLVLFGNCDAATAIAQCQVQLKVDALILTNPWLIDTPSALPPKAAIKARYGRKLRDPRQWIRLIRGDVNFSRLFRGLSSISATPSKNELANQLCDALGNIRLPVRIILASRDATALAFAEQWHSPGFSALRKSPFIQLVEIDTASHSFARANDVKALEAEVIDLLSVVSGRL